MTHDEKITALGDQGHKHGREITSLQAKTLEHDKDIAGLWKHKVGIDRYLWVERLVWAGLGGFCYYALMHLPALNPAAAILAK